MASIRIIRFSVNSDDSIFIEFEASKDNEVIVRSIVLSLEKIVENYYVGKYFKPFIDYFWGSVDKS